MSNHNGGKTMLENAEIIHSHSRADAISDGDLVDVSEFSREAGFNVPITLTRAAWEDCVAWSEDDNRRKRTLQDETGRLWDVLFMAAMAVRRTEAKHASACRFSLVRTPREGRGALPRRTYLKAIIGPDDDSTPVLTIMLPDED